ncbi:DNA ligase [Enterovibrio baiacu]|uniref:DNA ligase n=1 Tax=Enterovibrio baiacu TaxID=2491023 RepID=UPI003D0CCCF5
MKHSVSINILSIALLSTSHAHALGKPQSTTYLPLLAMDYEHSDSRDWSRYVYSEKLDGIRAYWTGERLVTRTGHDIHAPRWFTDVLPAFPVEGELWGGRGKFEHTLSVVMDDMPNEQEWKTIRFMLFDAPNQQGNFSQRTQAIEAYLASLSDSLTDVPEHLSLIPHYPAQSDAHIQTELNRLHQLGAEGIMLRHVDEIYIQGRDISLLKVKIAQDAEAEVIGYVEGKGKYTNMMGAIVVRMANGKTFKIGSGFSDKQREAPPPIGSKVTYRYNGYTKYGIPKFARFIRIDKTKQ